jgi:hypothetical protein
VILGGSPADIDHAKGVVTRRILSVGTHHATRSISSERRFLSAKRDAGTAGSQHQRHLGTARPLARDWRVTYGISRELVSSCVLS